MHHAFLAFLLVTIWLLPLAGCQGCWSSSGSGGKKLTAEEELEEKEKKKKKLAEKPKPDFEIAPTIILPNESGQDVEDDGKEKKPSAPKVVFQTKPGHWLAGTQIAKANNFDFHGELRTFPMDQSELPLDVQYTDFRLSMVRPASLPKGQVKKFETMFYLPRRDSNLSRSYSLRTELRATRSTRLPEIVNVAGSTMPEHEYYLVVLARNPSAYVDIAKLDSIQLQGGDLGFGGSPYGEKPPIRQFYHAVFPRTDKGVPLPSHPLAWTMIAYIVWDDLDPTTLTAEQQTALLDWLHWGGQLIISGPNSLDRLKMTWLEPYLPAASGKAQQIDNDRLTELNANWSVPSTKPLKKPDKIVVLPDKPLVGVELVKHPDSEWLPKTGELVLERQVGNGRIVVTAFPLSAPPYRFWASRDNFFNSCLLRRPGREFYNNTSNELAVRWTGSYYGIQPDDARLGTGLRYFTRDIGKLPTGVTPIASVTPSTPTPPSTTLEEGADPLVPVPQPPQPASPPVTVSSRLSTEQQLDRRFVGYQSDPKHLGGMAGWNDFSGAAYAAGAALNDASGIKIPRSDFVLKVLGVYILVLVPLNWFVFWLIGRVEYAWAAAPVIAVIAALAVVRLAQLDIGFARSRTEIAILESHAGYPRAHVTRYAALYTSLSTSYDLRFTDPDALALPLAVRETDDAKPKLRQADDVTLAQDETIALSDVHVRSNSTGKVHVEQMLTLDAPFQLTGDENRGWQLENGSQFKLRQAGILRRVRSEDDEGQTTERVEAAYFPEIPAGGTVRLNFQPVGKDNRVWVPQWDNSAMMSAAAPAEEENRVRLHRLSELAAQQLYLQTGEVRLIAWTADEIPGLKIAPSAAQNLTYTLVLVHLRNAALPKPEKDVRLRTEVWEEPPPDEEKKTDE